MVDIFEDFEPPSKKFLGTPLLLLHLSICMEAMMSVSSSSFSIFSGGTIQIATYW